MSELPQSLHAQLRDALRARILDGQLAPGAKLPSESELTAEHGVSRITVRQALGALQAEGLIVKLHGKGAFVSHPKAAQSLNRLQGLNEALALEQHAVSSKRLAWREVKAPAAVARQLQLTAGETVYHLQTLRYLDREPLSVNNSYLPRFLGERLARVDFSQRDLIEIFEHEGGLEIGEAQLEIGAGLARPQEAKLLQLAPGSPVLQVERLVHAAGGGPVHVEIAVYRADTFRYKLSLRR
ncbi:MULTISPECIES: GntR family transcriptional regulator [unclassified Variovorax]|uniref:GntR family transcriptional regulator n=1 Tax=unclassified Variovorax TaxID=663243 RepID=UPI0008827768|nr:GntR family transcriptional regulator [Variovorax sp. CF079]SDC78689.1 transcriptional regulator, GntR family [Variovorax sp. CF079]